MVAEVVVETETEESGGWRFEVVVSDPGGDLDATSETRHLLSLSWADYDHWCGGTARPETVARAVMLFLLSNRPAPEAPRRFDAATVRRWYPDIDDMLAVYF